MLYPSINELRKKVDSKYTLVSLASKRARDLIDGKPPLTDDASCDKPVSIAAEEIYEELITYNRDFSEDDNETEEVVLKEVDEDEFDEEEAPGYITIGD